MIKVQNLQISVNIVSRKYGRWNAFGARVMLSVIAATVIGFVSTTMIHLLMEGIMNLLFGGPSLSASTMKLAWILVVCLVIGAAGAAISRRKRETAPASASEPTTF